MTHLNSNVQTLQSGEKQNLQLFKLSSVPVDSDQRLDLARSSQTRSEDNTFLIITITKLIRFK